MKRIALLHYAYPPKIGGVERLMSEQASILADMGYPVHIVTGSGKESHPGITLTEVPELQAVRSFNMQLQERILAGSDLDMDLVRTIENALEKHLVSDEVIVVHNMLTLVHNLPFIAAFKNYVAKHPEKKILVWTHDQTYVDNGQVVMDKAGVQVNSQMKDLLLTPVTGATYVVISETFKGLLTEVMRIDPSLVHVIPNGVNMKKFLEIDDAMWISIQKEHLESAYPIIVSPVNILQRKNLEFSLEIIAKLALVYPYIRYLISGAVSEHRDTVGYEQAIKKKIEDLGLNKNVVFVGETLGTSMTDAQLHDLYQIADLIFYFSKHENFGLPILEAGLTKAPIWVSDLAVFHEIGGEFLTYIPEDSTSEAVAAQAHEYLKTAPSARLNHLVRTKYNLETIIKTKLVPLL